MRRLLVLLVLLVSCLPAGVHAQGQLCFPNVPGIPYCIQGRFLEYWRANGGLTAFGYPVSAAAQENNTDTGQMVYTQWFERNRFEYHPENNRPYDVLLGRLGADRLGQLGRRPDFEPKEDGPRDGCQYFAQVDRNVCNTAPGGPTGILDYWRSHGLNLDGNATVSYDESLALFGYPLTGLEEGTGTQGDPMLVQWFERARIEDHYALADGYRVLGLLGNEVHGNAPGTPTSPQQPTQPTAPPTTNEVKVLSATSYSRGSDVHIIGEVQNNTGQNAIYVKIIASIYDSVGTLVASDFTYSELDIVKPSQKSPFDVSMSGVPASAAKYQLAVQWRATDEQPVEGIQILSASGVHRSDGYHVFGEVKNNNSQSVKYVKLVITFYDANGKVVDADFTYTDVDILEPGQRSPFDLGLLHDSSGGARFEVVIQARYV